MAKLPWTRARESMAPLVGAAKLAVESFFKERRGGRVLRAESADLLADYNVQCGTTLLASGVWFTCN